MSSLRESLTAAMHSVASSESDTETPAAVDATSVETAPVAAPVESSTETPSTPPPSRARDESGRFAPKSTDAAPAKKEAVAPKAPSTVAPPAAPAEAQPTVEAAPAAKAPQSWTPAAREAWSKLPPEVQSEVQRREYEVAREAQAAAGAKRFAQEFGEVVRPHLATIQAEGGDVMRTVGNLFQTYSALRTATPEQKAGLVANMVRSFGVDIGALDAALAGAPPATSGAPAQGQYRDPRVDELLSTIKQSQQSRVQQTQQQALAEVEAFAKGAEFFEDVREGVADRIELAAKRGRNLSLNDAYEAEIRSHPEISGVLAQREAAAKAKEQQAAVAKARAAGSSVRSSPAAAPGANSGPKSIRDSLEAAIAAHR